MQKWLAAHAPADGLLESSPGVRSALIEYNADVLPLPQLLELLAKCAILPFFLLFFFCASF